MIVNGQASMPDPFDSKGSAVVNYEGRGQDELETFSLQSGPLGDAAAVN
jgi:hypothetical protein